MSDPFLTDDEIEDYCPCARPAAGAQPPCGRCGTRKLCKLLNVCLGIEPRALPREGKIIDAAAVFKLRAEAFAGPQMDAITAGAVWGRAMRREHERDLGRIHGSKRRAEKLKRTPLWADHEAIAAVYVEARRLSMRMGVEHHVDHVVPLQGKLVSGLHVHNNLEIIPAIDNLRKHNRFEP